MKTELIYMSKKITTGTFSPPSVTKGANVSGNLITDYSCTILVAVMCRCFFIT